MYEGGPRREELMETVQVELVSAGPSKATQCWGDNQGSCKEYPWRRRGLEACEVHRNSLACTGKLATMMGPDG